VGAGLTTSTNRQIPDAGSGHLYVSPAKLTNTKTSVLIVDDEPLFLESLKTILGLEGYTCDTALGGKAALEKLRNSTYDILLLDLQMPEVNGLQVLDYIVRNGIDSGVVVLSGTDSVKEATNALLKGAHAYLGKPYDPQLLIKTLHNVHEKGLLKRKTREMQGRLYQSERLHRLIVNNSPDLIFMLDGDGRFRFINERSSEFLGLSPEGLLGRPFVDFVATADQELIGQLVDDVISAAQPAQYGEIRLLQQATVADEVNDAPALVPVEISLVSASPAGPERHDESSVGIYGSARDLRAKKAAEQELQRTAARLQHVTEASPTVIYSRRLGGPDFMFLSANVKELLGYEADDLIGCPEQVALLVHPDDHECFKEVCAKIQKRPQQSCAYRLRHADGGWRWIRDTVRVLCDKSGNPTEAVGSWLDDTEAHSLSEQLRYQASHDALTGLENRRAFEYHLSRLIETARDEDQVHALCYLDLDQFKVINDTTGHVAGDALLRQLAHLLGSKIRKTDVLARLGGDEFGLLMEDCSGKDATLVAESLCREIEKFRFIWDDKTFQLGVSIGVVPITAQSESIESLLSLADSACYTAKDMGRNRVHAYQNDKGEVSRRQVEMEWVSHISHALEEDRFYLTYQTIVPADGAPEGHHYEILLRMWDKKRQLVMPGTFLPAAERYHMVERLDRWVVKNTLNWLRTHPRHLQTLSVCAINLSGHSMGDERLLGFLVEQLKGDPLLAGKLCFEVTETAAIANIGNAVEFIEALKSLGVRFALDDFGSGLSSFAYLKKLPVDFLKIDGVFVKNIVKDPVSLAMVRSINDIGHVMGMKTVAEFVGDEETLAVLREVGVDYAQGYGISKPRGLETLV
jgi:diguanylate cyclase (GGDEF)-like protein/PAS domain S-box-containing protein